jgi:hypothetical protein
MPLLCLIPPHCAGGRSDRQRRGGRHNKKNDGAPWVHQSSFCCFSAFSTVHIQLRDLTRRLSDKGLALPLLFLSPDSSGCLNISYALTLFVPRNGKATIGRLEGGAARSSRQQTERESEAEGSARRRDGRVARRRGRNKERTHPCRVSMPCTHRCVCCPDPVPCTLVQ